MRLARRLASRAPGLALPVLLALLAVARLATAGEIVIEQAGVSSPVGRRAQATLEIRTEPGAECSIEVIDRSGPSRADGLLPRAADDDGKVRWRWAVGSKATRGRWPIVVTCRRGRDLGRLETSFVVR